MKDQDYYSDKKVWCYYKKEVPFKTIYAFTFDKSIAKKFETQRNMKKFIREKVYLDELEEEYDNFIFSHKINELRWYPLYDGDCDISIISNELEMNTVNGFIDAMEDESNRIKRHLQSDYSVLNKKTRKFLCGLLKTSIHENNGDLVSNINSFHIFVEYFKDVLKI